MNNKSRPLKSADPTSSPLSKKKTLRRILRLFRNALFFIVGFLILYFSAAFCLSRMTVGAEKGQPQEVTIYIKTNGVHTDIVVPIKTETIDWSREIRFGNTHLKDTAAAWLGLGWGDKGFYLQTPEWSDLKASVAFRAAFALSTTAMHATFYNQLSENASCRKIRISKEQYKRLTTYIQESFQQDRSGHVIPVVTDQNYSNADAFYEAEGRYNLFRTCNTWTNTALKRAGQKACVWTIFDTGIFLKYE